MFKRFFRVSHNPKFALPFTFFIYLILAIFSWYHVTAMRENLIEVNAEATEHAVEGYVKYYEKWEDKRLEGAKTFIRIAHEPQLTLLIIDVFAVFIVFFIATVGAGNMYYEYKVAKLRKEIEFLKKSSVQQNV